MRIRSIFYGESIELIHGNLVVFAYANSEGSGKPAQRYRLV